MSRLIKCEVDASATSARRASPRTVASNLRAVVYLRSFPTAEKQHQLRSLSVSFSPRYHPLACALGFHNVIYGAWRNSFRFLGLRTTEFTTPDVLTSSFFPLTPSPHRPHRPYRPTVGACARVCRGVSRVYFPPRQEKGSNWSTHVCTYTHIYSRVRRG